MANLLNQDGVLRAMVDRGILMTRPQLLRRLGAGVALGSPLRVSWPKGVGTGRPPTRANIYIDGFNLYHGCIDDHRNRRHYHWLDLNALSQNLCHQASVNRIRYFTALVGPYPSDPRMGRKI